MSHNREYVGWIIFTEGMRESDREMAKEREREERNEPIPFHFSKCNNVQVHWKIQARIYRRR